VSKKTINPKKDELIKAAIIEAARRVFQKWGLKKSTMEDIAEEAGKGKSTLYYYFKSKEEIFDIVLRGETDRILANAKAAVEHEPETKEKLKKYIISTLTEMRKNANVYSIVRGEIKGNKLLIEKLKKELIVREESFVRGLFRDGIRTNELKFINPDEIDIAAKAFVGILAALDLYLFVETEDFGQIDITAKLISNII
jgi:AcrR family transcriptional regulator